MLRKLMFGMAIALSLAVSTPSNATTALALNIDGSGSISSSDFDLQKDGYINALTDLYGANPGLFGQNAIGVWQFSTTVQLEHALTVINTQADLDDLLDDIAAMSQLNGNTAIGDSIADAATALTGFGFGDRLIIDVSTDGVNNTGVDPGVAAAAAVAGGIDQVNCLGVGGAANCSFIAGTGSFSIVANDFGEFETAIATKLSSELLVPEPASMVLIASGLIGLGVARRRRAA